MISRPTPATSSTLRSPPQPPRSPSSTSRPNTPPRRSMPSQSTRHPRSKASAQSGSDDALFALLGMAAPEAAQAVDPPAKKSGLLTLTQPQMAAIRGESITQSPTPKRQAKARKNLAMTSGTDSDVPVIKQSRDRGGKGKGKAVPSASTHTDSGVPMPRPPHARHKSAPVARDGSSQNAHLQPAAPWDGPPRLDRELEPFAVDSEPLLDARAQSLLEPLESSKPSSRSQTPKRTKQAKPKRVRERDRDRTDDSDAFETTTLSKSLPASGFAMPPSSRVDSEADVWDMPIEIGQGAGEQALTWQQALQKSTPNGALDDHSTPHKRPNRKAAASASRQQPARAAKGARRSSFDQSFTQVHGAGHGFVYPGMNASRPPQVQTPTKSVPAFALTGALEEPHNGQPAGHGQGVGSAISRQYAGPTFHNSPLAGSLPRPNEDDF